MAADLRRSPVGAAALVLLVALAVALGVGVSVQERAIRESSTRAADPFDILVGAEGSETQLVLSTIYLQPASLELVPGTALVSLVADPRVSAVSPIGFGDSFHGFPVIGVAPALVARLAAGKLEGAAFARLDEAVVGAAVPLAPGATLHPTHGLIEPLDEDEGSERHDFSYRVTGRLPRLGSPWDRAILVPIEAVWWIHSLPLGHAVDDAVLWPRGTGGAPDLAAVPIGPPWSEPLGGMPAVVVTPRSFAGAYQLRQEWRQAPGTTALFPAEVLIRLHGLLGDVRDVLALVSAMTQALVMAAVLLAVVAAMAQRQKLIAILRALGASRAYIFATVWLEVALLLTLAALLGLPLGLGCAKALARVVEARTDMVLTPQLAAHELGLVGGTIGIALALAVIPALLAYRAAVAEALRG